MNEACQGIKRAGNLISLAADILSLYTEPDVSEQECRAVATRLANAAETALAEEPGSAAPECR